MGSTIFHLAEVESATDAPDRTLNGKDYGPITPLLNDDTISEVMVNGPDQIYVERKGQLTLADVKFPSNAELIRVIREIAAFLREVNPKLHRALLRNRAREASRVLDVLFDAQEYLLPHFAEVV